VTVGDIIQCVRIEETLQEFKEETRPAGRAAAASGSVAAAAPTTASSNARPRERRG
jgi:hypothetical protein